jgi:hypothetical protein
MRGRFRESELVETPPHRAEFWFSPVPVALSPQSPDQVRGGRGTPHRSAIVPSVRDSALATDHEPRAFEPFGFRLLTKLDLNVFILRSLSATIDGRGVPYAGCRLSRIADSF